MLLTMMKAKLHRATVTQADLEYEGSIAIDRDLLDQSGILPHEQVDVLNITNGARFTTYAIEAPRGSRVIGVNGAAARLVQKGDKVIVVTYCQLPVYARPVFVRLQPQIETTGTFKYRKMDLVADGFDPARVKDPIYFRDPTKGAYVKVTKANHAKLVAGGYKL